MISKCKYTFFQPCELTSINPRTSLDYSVQLISSIASIVLHEGKPTGLGGENRRKIERSIFTINGEGEIYRQRRLRMVALDRPNWWNESSAEQHIRFYVFPERNRTIESSRRIRYSFAIGQSWKWTYRENGQDVSSFCDGRFSCFAACRFSIPWQLYGGEKTERQRD